MIKDYRFWLIVGCAAFMMLFNLGKRDLWDPDEPRYAQVAREMVDDGDLVLMRINGDPYPDKPPLYFWAVGALSKITGSVDEFTARFPSAISGVLVVALAMILAGRMFGVKTGLIAGLLLVTSYAMLGEARYVHMDMPLTLITVGMFIILYKGAFSERPNPKLWLPFFILGGLATLLKGPSAILTPLFAAFAFMVFKRLGKMERPKVWAANLIASALIGMIVGGPKGLVVCLVPGVILLFATGGLGRGFNRWLGFGFIAFLIIVGAWLAPACIKGEAVQPGYTKELLITQNLTRYEAAFSHEAPFYYYFYILPMLFVPWIFFLPQSISRIFRDRLADAGEKRKLLFLLAWVVGYFVFFSLSSSKREIYLIPLFPGMAILVSRYIEKVFFERANGQPGVKSARIILACCGFLIMILAVLLPLFTKLMEGIHKEEITKFLNVAETYIALRIAVGAAFFLVGAFIVVQAARGRRKLLFAAACFSTLFAVSLAEFYAMPVIGDPFKSAREFSTQLLKRADGNEIAIYGVNEAILYYGRRRLVEMKSPEDIALFMSDKSKPRFCVMTDRRADDLDGKKKIFFKQYGMYKVYAGSIGGKDLIVFSNQQPPVPPDAVAGPGPDN